VTTGSSGYGEAGVCRTYPGVITRLTGLRPDELRGRVTEAWRLVAPKRLIGELDRT
jgi:hypothetical protein